MTNFQNKQEQFFQKLTEMVSNEISRLSGQIEMTGDTEIANDADMTKSVKSL